MELIVVGIMLFFSVISLFLSRKNFDILEMEEAKLKKQIKPVTVKKAQLSTVTQQYKNLQSRYKTSLNQLKANEYQFTCYDLGVGSMDSVSYSALYSTDNLTLLEGKLTQIKEDIKFLVKNKRACVCHFGKDVTVNGRRGEATKLFNREIKLRLRCIDNEFKSAFVLVDWNNINRLIDRLKSAYKDINDSGDIVKTFIKKEYLDYKIEELRLSYEIRLLKNDIKEKEREDKKIIREAEREDEKIKSAADKALNARKVMEELVAKELSKLEFASEEQRLLLTIHQEELLILKEKEQRAVSMAQQTRAGFVYIISNENSFGRGVCKIGMTRRVDPQDRVKELGDASVPELFNVHAFIYSEDAPKLEKYLHKCFFKERVNLVNSRKEFFYVEAEQVISKLKAYEEKIDINLFEVKWQNPFRVDNNISNENDDNSILNVRPTVLADSDPVKANKGKKKVISEQSYSKVQEQFNPKLCLDELDDVTSMSKFEALTKLHLTFHNVILMKNKAIRGKNKKPLVDVPQVKNNSPLDLQDIIDTINAEEIEYPKRFNDKNLFDRYIEKGNYKIAAIKGKEIILKQRKKVKV